MIYKEGRRFVMNMKKKIGICATLLAAVLCAVPQSAQAAGKIHSDFERGFIRAEIVAFDDLVKLGSMNAAKESGLVRSEGKDYVIKDGDIVLFRFNV